MIHGQKKSISDKQEFIETIDLLFLKLELAYHYQFYKVFGTDERLKEGKKQWAVSLQKFPNKSIISAIEAVITNQSYLPTLTDLMKSCEDINSENNLPSVEEAFIEARKSFSPRAEYDWSHPIIYFAGKKIGWSNLNEDNLKSTYSSFKKVYGKLAQKFQNGHDFKLNNSFSSKQEKTKMNKELFEKLRKKHRV